MKDIALHILDVANNSVSAKAELIEIIVDEQTADNTLTITIKDNGRGMSPEFLSRVTDPFTTTRTTRKVGMGISLLKQNAELTGGYLTIDSTENVGTTLKAVFTANHIDRPPLGDLAGVITILFTGNSEINFTYIQKLNNKYIIFGTFEIKEALEEVSINDPQIVKYVNEMIEEGIKDIYV